MKNTLEQENTVQQGKSVTKVLHLESRCNTSKAHVDYWRNTIRKRIVKGVESANWYAFVGLAGRREWFNLQTPNKTAAAETARQIYSSLVSDGWASALAKFKPKGNSSDSDIATVGDLVEAIKLLSDLKPVTFEIYAGKFRSLVVGMFGLQGGREKFDYVNGGNAKWIEKIHKVKLDRLTPERIQAYKVRYLKEASSDPLSLKRAQTTLNSVLRASKCLFTPRIQKQIGKTVSNPFKEIENIKLPKNRYRSEINPDLLLMQARRELMEQHPEEFKVLILALGCGLRRDEIDTLAWSQVDYTRNQIRIETTEHTTAKSDESEALVDVDPGLIEMLRSFMAASQSPFVINSPNAPRPNTASYHHYRCSKVFDRLIAWLRSKGMKARNALHTLRKEFGSQICAQAGIYAASTALRHANIALTASVYTDKKRTVFYSVTKALTESAAPQGSAEQKTA